MILSNKLSTINQKKWSEQKNTNSYQNGGLSFSEKLSLATSTPEEAGEFTATDSIGIMLKQMENIDDMSKTFMHNKVQIQIVRDEIMGDTVTFGTETDNTNWVSFSSDGVTITFDVNNPEAILACLDLFSPFEIRKILEMITMNRMAMSNLRDLEEDKDKILEEEEGEKEFLETKESKESQLNHILDTSDINQNLSERTEERIGKLFEDESNIVNPSLDSILNKGEKSDDEEESETSSEIVVNADGSRTLIVKMNIGGLITSMSMEISKPSEFQQHKGNSLEDENSSENVEMTENVIN